VKKGGILEVREGGSCEEATREGERPEESGFNDGRMGERPGS
jgi:hypothetical protein